MKKSKLLVSVAAVALFALVAESALARHHGRHPRPGYGHGYSDGFFAGLLASTMAILISDTLFNHHHYKELILIGADEDAAAFLANGEQPSAVLQQVMQMERALIQAAGVDAKLSDEDIATMIIERAALLQ